MKDTYKQPKTIKVTGKGKKLSKKVMGKEVGDGEFYADPYRGGDPEAFYGYNGYPNDTRLCFRLFRRMSRITFPTRTLLTRPVFLRPLLIQIRSIRSFSRLSSGSLIVFSSLTCATT